MPIRIGQEVGASWRGEDYYQDDLADDFLALPDQVEQTKGPFEFLGKGWLKARSAYPALA